MPTKLEIKNEITIDPSGPQIGYAISLAQRDDSNLLVLINLPRKVAVKEKMINSRYILENINNGVDLLIKLDLIAQTTPQLAKLITFMNSEEGLDFGNNNVRAIFQSISAQLTGPELNALKNAANRLISRAEELWGANLTIQELSIALNS